MASAGEVAIQGCAIRVGRLNSDGSISAASTTGMIVDDKPFVKLTAKPNMEAGVEITPKSACGVPLISYKDYDRAKRWDVSLDMGDADFDKWEMIGGGALLTASTSAGRAVTDGVTVNNDFTLTSASAAFTAADVGRSVTGTGIQANTFISLFVNSTTVRLSLAATASASGVSITFGAIASRTVGYSFPALLSVPNANGVSIEIWQKAITRGTGFQGTTPYPSVGSLSSPALTGSGFIRWGIFRFIPVPNDIGMEDKEGMRNFSGWAIENPNFGLGPAKDWTTNGQVGGTPVDTTKWCNALMDYQLPATLQAGYQTTAA